MKTKHKGLFSGLLIALCASNLQAATLSGEEFKQYGSEQAYWVVSVSCDDNSDARVIQRKTDGNEWCGKDIDGFCSDSKNEVVEKVCSAQYTSALNEISQALEAKTREDKVKKEAEDKRRRAEDARRQAASREAAVRAQAAEATRQNQISIDERLLQIEQEKLSLRRQELELQRRAVKIRELLEELEK